MGVRDCQTSPRECVWRAPGNLQTRSKVMSVHACHRFSAVSLQFLPQEGSRHQGSTGLNHGFLMTQRLQKYRRGPNPAPGFCWGGEKQSAHGEVVTSHKVVISSPG